MMKCPHWLVLAALLATSDLFVQACPIECSCSSSGVVVDCSDRGLTQIPEDLPKDAVTL